MSIQFESDLYEPIKKYFTSYGFNVYGEVNHCDMCIVRDDHTIIIELKKALNIKLLCQGVQRQKLSDSVYLAIPHPKNFSLKGEWKEIIHLLRRLELGLIFVKNSEVVTIVVDPMPFDRLKSKKASVSKMRALSKELQGRSLDGNVGGSRGKKILTAYREQVIRIAVLAEAMGKIKASDCCILGIDPRKASGMMRTDYYGWFHKVDRGIFELTAAGKEALGTYHDIAKMVKLELKFKEETDESH